MIWHDIIFPMETEMGNCSACCFRNATGLCNKMVCFNLDTNIYWFSKEPGLADGLGISKLVDFYKQDQEIIKAECLKKLKI